MKFRDLKHIKDVTNLTNSDAEESFIYLYGLFNCKILKCKNGNEILTEMRKAYPDEEFSFEQVNFMHEISNKEVLVGLNHSHNNNPDIFVYPENNTPFTVECFI